MNKTIKIVMFCGIVGLFGVHSACVKQEKQTERKPVLVEIMTAIPVQTIPQNTYIGKVEEGGSFALGFPLGGKIASVNTKKGKQVRKGDVLATVEDIQQRNALKTAEATLKQAQDGYKRLKTVYEQGALAEVKWVEMTTNLEKAQATYDIADKQLSECILYAPQDGLVEECDLQIGQQLLPSQTAIKLIDTNGLVVSFSVSETEICNINIGDETDIIVPALGNMHISAKITEKDMTANLLSHAYTVKSAISNSDCGLLPDMMCKVSLRNTDISGFVVPADCVQLRYDTQTIWTVKNAKAHRTEVKTTMFVDDGVLIESGIRQGDSIITKGWQKVWEGASVTTL